MTIAYQPSFASTKTNGFGKNQTYFNVSLRIPETCLNLLQSHPDGYIPGHSVAVPEIPGLSIQPLFAVRPHPGEGKKFVVALRINNSSFQKTTMLPYEIDYHVQFESGNFSKRYRASSIPVNPTNEIEVFDALSMKVFNFEDFFNPKNKFINNGEVGVCIFGSIRA